MKILLTVIIVVLVLAAAFGVYVNSGLYDVAADAAGTPFVDSLLIRVRERSIQRRVQGIKVPPLNDPQLVALGAAHYHEMCVECHLAPQVNRTEIREGLDPRPPDLVRIGAKIPPAVAFWVIKHGIRMTAMPAWGKTHDDHKIWAMVAFIRRLPNLSHAEYETLVAQGEAQERASGGEEEMPGMPQQQAPAPAQPPGSPAQPPSPGQTSPPSSPNHAPTPQLQTRPGQRQAPRTRRTPPAGTAQKTSAVVGL